MGSAILEKETHPVFPVASMLNASGILEDLVSSRSAGDIPALREGEAYTADSDLAWWFGRA